MSAKDRILSPAQAGSIAAILSNEFEPHVHEVDPKYSGFAVVSKWVSQRKDRVFVEDPLFTTEQVKGDVKQYKQAVDRKFRNYYYKLRGQANGTRSTPSGLDDSFVKLFVPRPTALQLYEEDVKEELLEKTSGHGAGLYQTRLKEMWDELDEEQREEYENETETVASNVEHNRKLLVSNYASALDVLCRNNALGGMLATTVFGYRDTNGEVQFVMLDGRLAKGNPGFGDHEEEKEVLSNFEDAWRGYADRNLPRPPPPRSTASQGPAILRNSHGIPVFPSLDMKLFLPHALEAIVIEYIEAVWDYSRDLHHPYSPPWEELVTNAPDFYDVTRYDFMCFDRSILGDPVVIYPLASKLMEKCGIASTEPFTFSPTNDATPSAHSHAGPPDNPDQQDGACEPGTNIDEPAIGAPTTQLEPHVSGSSSGADADTPPEQPVRHSGSPVHGEQLVAFRQGREKRKCGGDMAMSDLADQDVDDELVGKGQDGGVSGDVLAPARKRTRVKQAKPSATKPSTVNQRQPSTAKAGAAKPRAATSTRNIFASHGYQFKLTKQLQIGCYIGFDEYMEDGGRVIGADEFNERKEILALIVIERDPEWLANRAEWQKHVLARPEK